MNQIGRISGLQIGQQIHLLSSLDLVLVVVLMFFSMITPSIIQVFYLIRGYYAIRLEAFHGKKVAKTALNLLFFW